MNRPGDHTQPVRPLHPGFTLIELMIVIGVIALLTVITLSVGTSMINTGKKHATKGVLEALDQTLEAYIDAKGEMPPALVEIRNDDLPRSIATLVGNDNPAFYPAVDGTTDRGQIQINSVGLYLYAAQNVPAVQDILAGINPKLIKQYAPTGAAGGGGGGFGNASSMAEQPTLLTVFDAWGNPIRFVHPKFDGIIEKNRRAEGSDGEQFNISRHQNGFFEKGLLDLLEGNRSFIIQNVRRNKMTPAERTEDPDLVADSDGGKCPGPRPYFYSAGPDGDPSTTEDNVYTTVPTFIDPF